MQNEVRKALIDTLSTHGQTICENPQQLEHILREQCGDYRREIHLLITALHEHIPTQLLDAQEHTPPSEQLIKLTRHMYDNLGTAEEFGWWTVETWGLALGVFDTTQLDATALLEEHLQPQPVTSMPAQPQSLDLVGHMASVYCLAFTPDGKTAISGSEDKTIRMWDIATGRQIRRIDRHRTWIQDIAISPDGKNLASASGNWNGVDHTVRLWDMASGQELWQRASHADWVSSVTFHPQGEILATGSGDKTIRFWDVATGLESQHLVGHTDSVNDIAFSPDGKLLASGGRDQMIYLWDSASGREINRIPGHLDTVVSIAFSPDGKLLASASRDQSVRVWEVASGRELLRLERHTSRVTSIQFSPDGSLIASGSHDGTIRLWNVERGQEVQQLQKHADRKIMCLAFSPNGRILVTGGYDSSLRFWNLGVPADEWMKMEKIWVENRLREDHEIQEQHERERQQRQWRIEGRCEVCGANLNVWEKMRGLTCCKQHRR
jgi:WD40 repeat protein